MPPAIRVTGLGKQYKLRRTGHRADYRTLRESLTGLVMRTLGRRDPGEARTGLFSALENIEFQVETGEVIGIVGRNGAGKSTLLKILSRIIRPTTGRVELRGRVGSLLEVGTGFHPELTGRENIYLNGSILGMRRGEISRRFDEIVAFAEVESFLDTPVKHYSSGMYMRLAFAVASHLETEILLVDEVLAVGDGAFQKKCLGKLGGIGREGRTIIFVSHNMHAVAKLAGRSLLLDGGRLIASGETPAIIHQYLATEGQLQPEWHRTAADDGREPGPVSLTSIRVCDARGQAASRLRADEAFFIEIGFRVATETDTQIAFRLNSNSDATTVFTSSLSDRDDEHSTRFPRGDFVGRCPVPAHLLSPGSYHLLVAANNPKGKAFDLIEQVLNFEMTEVGSLTNFDHRLGYIAPRLHWDVDHRHERLTLSSSQGVAR